MTIAEIQAQFPHPARAMGRWVNEPGSYCVGGALCLRSGQPWHWPERGQLALALGVLNPALPAAQGRWYAGRIIAANDRAEFARAWRWAGAALARTDAHKEVATDAP